MEWMSSFCWNTNPADWMRSMTTNAIEERRDRERSGRGRGRRRRGRRGRERRNDKGMHSAVEITTHE